ncbi:hypothetical protein D910_11663 [Dendroctonus ponderosae]|uniref:Reverse transcriptase domain-containing protein n=1 Tax=Dendroctonus ponderosae TaxID=77166 RepID=U4UJZ2_DENPD|nr:hypothetical protein D910_11663 [Dendroctonus ponderosae]
MLKTVTYGTAPASHLATRCLKELSIRCSQENSIISRIIAEDFYVDDLCTGGSTVQEVLNIKQQVSRILLSAGFELRKFYCNVAEVIENTLEQTVHIGESSSNKKLGLYWDTANATFKYSINVQLSQRFTTRTILSCIAQIFDPLGLLVPVVMLAKIIIQKLGQCKKSWDESIPLDILTSYRGFYSQLGDLNDLEVSRKIRVSRHVLVELHGFADANETGYGACIHLRSVNGDGHCSVSLLCSKTRVASMKTTTIPRLELCAAFLLAELYRRVIGSLNISFDKSFFWSDSTIVFTPKTPPDNTFRGMTPILNHPV